MRKTVIILSGPPGSGKSSMVKELIRGEEDIRGLTNSAVDIPYMVSLWKYKSIVVDEVEDLFSVLSHLKESGSKYGMISFMLVTQSEVDPDYIKSKFDFDFKFITIRR